MEPKIKLFGSKIMFPDVAEASEGSGGYGCDSSSGESGGDDDGGKILQAEEEERVAETSERDELERNEFSVTSADEPQNPGTVRSSDENPNEEGEAVSAVDLTNGNDGKNMQQKPLKKPDKILPCPRCNSMDTKFCYYNNYNINQPRHFCKSCQRYWTAGGMMRNLPVGAGRRKTKNSSSHCHHIAISEALGGARMDDSSNPHLPAMKAGSTVLSFSPDSSLCESIASGLKLADKRAQNGPGNGVYNGGKIVSPVPCMNKDSNGGDASSKGAAQVPIPQNLNGFSSPVPCIPSVAWTYPMNPAVPIPAIYPMPFFPPPYWNCAVPNPWVVPWLPVMSPSPDHNATSFAPASPLGKHSRNGELLKSKKPESEDPTEPEKSEGSIVVPKTLRVGDPEEAAKSSIWKTLGIKYDSLSREGLFKALQPKDQKENAPHSTSQALQANPAALSRSMTFQETA